MEALFRHLREMPAVVTADLLKAADSTKRQELLDTTFPDIPAEARVLPAEPDSQEAESVYWYNSFSCDLIYRWNKRKLHDYIDI